MAIELRPLSYALGAEVRGVDFTRPVGDAGWRAIHDALLKFGVLLSAASASRASSTSRSAGASASSTGTSPCRSIASRAIPSFSA